MPLSSIVVVADREAVEGGGVQLAFKPGDDYPIQSDIALSVRDQPFPQTRPPHSVVPAILSVRFRYGRVSADQQPPPFEPEEHSLRELWFEAGYKHGSWHVTGNEAGLSLTVTAGLRDNTPSGEQSAPDDPFALDLVVQALCIWATEMTLLERLAERVPFHIPRP